MAEVEVKEEKTEEKTEDIASMYEYEDADANSGDSEETPAKEAEAPKEESSEEKPAEEKPVEQKPAEETPKAEEPDDNSGKEQKPTLEEFKLNLSEDVFDPEYIKQLNAMNEHYKTQFGKLSEQVAEVTAEIEQQRAKAFEERLDTMVLGMGKDWEKVLGSENAAHIDRKSEEFANRQKIVASMNELAAGKRALGQKVPSEKELFDSAMKLLFADNFKEIEMAKVADKLSKREKQAINPVSSTAKKAVAPEQAAGDFATTFYRDAGFPTPVAEEEEEF